MRAAMRFLAFALPAIAATFSVGAPAQAASFSCRETPIVRSNAALAPLSAKVSQGKALTILAIGSSSTEGVGASAKDKTYPARLQALLAKSWPKSQVEIVICPPSAIQDLWSRRFPDPVTAFASGWMRVRARARQKGVELPLIISDHADWDDLQATIREVQANEIWITHGEAEALARWCGTVGLKGMPLHLVGYGDEGEADPVGEAADAASV